MIYMYRFTSLKNTFCFEKTGVTVISKRTVFLLVFLHNSYNANISHITVYVN